MDDRSGKYNDDSFLVFELALVTALLLSLYKTVRRLQAISRQQKNSTQSVTQHHEKHSHFDSFAVMSRETTVEEMTKSTIVSETIFCMQNVKNIYDS